MAQDKMGAMRWKRKVAGGVMGVIGFLLSPLSWWNDVFVNVPLAIGFGWFVALFHKPAFGPGVVVGYWLTNVIGFILLHKGATQMLSEAERRYTWRHLARDVSISLLYTALIVALVQLKVLKPVGDYLQGN